MFMNLPKDDLVLEGELFRKDEVRYNLLHLICGSQDALRVRTEDGRLVIAQTPGFNPWLWISSDLSPGEKDEMIRRLAEYMDDREFPGITADLDIADRFARYYSTVKPCQPYPYMTLEAYECPEVFMPWGVQGIPEKATVAYTEKIAAYMAAFSQEAFGRRPDSREVYKAATSAVSSGGMYLWKDGDQIVSMARIAHRSPRHARINDVYTPPAHRKKGYASALVASLSLTCKQNGLTPMLYADAKNPDSNKVYRSIGFVHAGRLEEFRFA